MATHEALLSLPPQIDGYKSKSEFIRERIEASYELGNSEELAWVTQWCHELRSEIKARRPKGQLAEPDAEEVIFKLIWYLVANGKIRT